MGHGDRCPAANFKLPGTYWDHHSPCFKAQPDLETCLRRSGGPAAAAQATGLPVSLSAGAVHGTMTLDKAQAQ